MKLIPSWVSRAAAAMSSTSTPMVKATDPNAVGVTDIPIGPRGSWFSGGRILESFAGAWQKNIVVDNLHDVTAFSGVYACVSLITNDISKLRPRLMIAGKGQTTQEFKGQSPFTAVLSKPNNYQTRIQFLGMWMASKLLFGNAFILLVRDGRGVVVGMHVLDPRRVKPLVTQVGDVYYQLSRDTLAQTNMGAVSASEIIHDRGVCLWHPLVGVSPIYACGAAATQGNRIQANSAKFFENMSRPSGMLTAPDLIDDATAARLKATFDSAFGGLNIGKLFVAGEGIEYTPITMSAQDAQMIDQLKWTVVDAARCFHVPLYKIGAEPLPARTSVSEQNDAYYAETLQIHIESIELLLQEALSLPPQYTVELDLTGLLRMDETGMADVLQKVVAAGIMAPNEARYRLNLPPTAGGDSPLLQQQNWSLAALAKRPVDSLQALTPGGSTGAPPPPPPPPNPEPPNKAAAETLAQAEMLEVLATVMKGLQHA